MSNAVKNTEAMVVVSQENMLEKLQYSEVVLTLFWDFALRGAQTPGR